MEPTADDVAARLQLAPHPEGGRYRRTWTAPPAPAAPGTAPGTAPGGRAAASAIHHLLAAGERSHWHRVDAAEVWLHHAGAPLVLERAEGDDDEPAADLLGPDVLAGQQPQLVVPAGWWQAAATTGAWTLVSCVVVPAFGFDGFELAPPGFRPGARRDG